MLPRFKAIGRASMGKIQKISIALTEELAETVRAEVALLRELWKEGIDSGPSEFETIDDIIAEARERHAAGRG
jgi:hypothetical protein